MLYFPPDVQAMFTGTEQEGDVKGAYTLFVVNEVAVLDIKNAIDRLRQAGQNVRQIYLGAGFLSKATPEYVESVAQAFDEIRYDGTEITIEASYFDAGVLVRNPNITRWVYTAMMLDVVNPNYYNTMWFLNHPRLWKNSGFTDSHLERVHIKVDFARTTIVTPAKQAHYSRYQDYSDDKLLACNYPDDLPDVPYPRVYQLNPGSDSEPLDLQAVITKADSYEVKVGWSPKLIFRSK